MNFECIVDLKNINKEGDIYIFSSCFLKNNHEIYIVTSNCHENDSIKIFNLKGNKIKEIENNNGQTRFIDSYYDKILSKNFIIAEGMFKLISYDYNSKKTYKKYDSPGPKTIPSYNIFIYEDEDKTKLIGINKHQVDVKLWDFHSGQILKIIKIKSQTILDKFCL